VPLARTGFQIAFRAGAAVPLGRIADDFRAADMADNFDVQGYFGVEAGSKVIPELFIGAYLGMGMGSAGSALDAQCNSCLAMSGHLGPVIQYHVLPAKRVNPWVGYGLGFDFAQVMGSGTRTMLIGFEWASLSAGVDFRLVKRFGIGPFANVSLGHYWSAKSDVAGIEYEHDISNPTIHEWITFGVRMVINP
jgi:hypothetical protein